MVAEVVAEVEEVVAEVEEEAAEEVEVVEVAEEEAVMRSPKSQ